MGKAAEETKEVKAQDQDFSKKALPSLSGGAPNQRDESMRDLHEMWQGRILTLTHYDTAVPNEGGTHEKNASTKRPGGDSPGCRTARLSGIREESIIDSHYLGRHMWI